MPVLGEGFLSPICFYSIAPLLNFNDAKSGNVAIGVVEFTDSNKFVVGKVQLGVVVVMILNVNPPLMLPASPPVSSIT